MCFTGVANSPQSVALCVSQVWQTVGCQLPHVFHSCCKRSAVSCPVLQVWQAVRSQFEKPEIKRVYESRGGEELLKDMSAVHQYPHAGFGLIKIHLAESDAR